MEVYTSFSQRTTDGKEYITVFNGNSTGDCENIMIDTGTTTMCQSDIDWQ